MESAKLNSLNYEEVVTEESNRLNCSQYSARTNQADEPSKMFTLKGQIAHAR